MEEVQNYFHKLWLSIYNLKYHQDFIVLLNKENEYLNKYYDINFFDHSIRETCKIPNKEYILKQTIPIDYGNNIINYITFPLTRFGQQRNELNN